MPHIVTMRHEEIIDPMDHKNRSILLAGAGAIGSRVFMSLVELGLTRITVVDPDIVEAHNLANQAFTNNELGTHKAFACAQLYQAKTGYAPPEDMYFRQCKLPDQDIVDHDYVFLCVDSMAAREEIFEAYFDACAALIDTRMASTHGNVFVVNRNHPLHSKYWHRTLFSDDQGEVSSCGSPMTVGATAAIAANLAVWRLIQLLRGDSTEFRTNFFLNPLVVATANE